MRGIFQLAALALFATTASAFSFDEGCLKPAFDNIIVDPELEYYVPRYTLGATITITCEDGYYLFDYLNYIYVENNAVTATCLIGGKYSIHMDYECTETPPVYCERPTVVGLVPDPDYKKYSVGEEVTFSCTEEYALYGSATCICESSGLFSPAVPTCRPKCPKPMMPHLIVFPTDKYYRAGTRIILRCEEGYKLIGSSRRRCETSGNIHPPIKPGICKRKGCDKPPKIKHGEYKVVKPRYDVDDEITYTCFINYKLVGKPTRVCDSTGNFIYGEPTCVEILCKKPMDIDNGYFTPDDKETYSVSEFVTYECDVNYKLSTESGKRTCLLGYDGLTAEFELAPSCIRVECDKPKPLDNGKYEPMNEVYYIGDTVDYMCDRGYLLEGYAEATCTLSYDGLSGYFTDPPICMPVKCSKPDPLVNGGYEPGQESYFIKETVTYTCDRGYLLQGESVAECVLSYDGLTASFTEAPVCIPVKCSKPDPLVNGGYEPGQESYFIKETVTYTCDSGYLLKGESVAECVLSYDGLTASFTEAPVCIPIYCKTPDDIDNGKFEEVKKKYRIGEEVMYECFETFYLVGEVKATCVLVSDTMAEFTDAPVCKPILCDKPMPIDNGGFTPIDQDYFTIGEDVDYYCDINYKLDGDAKATCEQTGKKTAEFSHVPGCVRVECDMPKPLDNGKYQPMNKVYYIGDTVDYMCDRGYLLEGYAGATCTLSYDGLYGYFPDPPICMPVKCSKPDPLVNGGYEPGQESYFIKETVTYTCDRGYLLQGESVAECVLSYDGLTASFTEAPVCIPVKCSKPDPLVNGGYEPGQESYFIKETVTYTCDSGYLLKGESVAECVLSYDGLTASFTEPPVCIPIYCKTPDDIEHGKFEKVKKKYRIGEEVMYECFETFYLVGEVKATCVLVSDTMAEFTDAPVCKPILCDKPMPIDNGGFTPSDQDYFTIGENVDYYCDINYKLDGDAKATCEQTGEETAEFNHVPGCVRVECDRPMPLENGMFEPVKKVYYIGNTVEYMCNRGYLLEGFAEATCSLSYDGLYGYFSDPPVCKPVKCKAPDPLTNGGYEPGQESYFIKETVTYTCDRGYLLKGESVAECVLSYDGLTASFTKAPVCIPVKCKKPAPIANGEFDPEQESYHITKTITYTCDYGYLLEGESTAECVLSYDGLTASFTEAPICTRIYCYNPGEPTNGGIVMGGEEKYVVDDVITFYCDNCYMLVGYETATCTTEGKFDHDVPICKLKVCPTHPVLPDDGTVRPFKKFYDCGEVIDYTCSKGYNLYGEGTTECLDSGDFSGKTPTCKVVTCPMPKLNKYVSVKPRKRLYTYNSEITYSCRGSGYTLDGETKAVCLETGKFSYPSPFCKENKCGRPPIPDHGGIIDDDGREEYDPRDFVDYECDQFYELSGDVYNECGFDGQWKYPAPKCESASCADNCYLGYTEGRPCQCHSGCHDEGNCCDDYFESCQQHSCYGRCGDYRIGSCSCSENCRTFFFGCCKDFFDACTEYRR